VYESVPVIISGVPKQREGIFLFDNVSNQTSIYYLDALLNPSFFKTLAGDFLGSAVNYYNQQLICVGSISGKVTALDVKYAIELWSLPLVNSAPFPSFTGVFSNNQTVYVAFYNGNIKGYDSGGTPNYGAQGHSGHYGETGLIHNDVLLMEQPSQSVAGTRMLVYWLVSGIERHQITLNEDVIGMYSLNQDEVVLLTNDASSNGRLTFYSIRNNVRSNPFNIGSGKIDAITEISTGVYLIARNGDLKIINANSFSTLPYLSGVSASTMRYDALTDELLVVSGNTLSVYDYSSRVLIKSYTHPHPILDVQLHYNRE